MEEVLALALRMECINTKGINRRGINTREWMMLQRWTHCLMIPPLWLLYIHLGCSHTMCHDVTAWVLILSTCSSSEQDYFPRALHDQRQFSPLKYWIIFSSTPWNARLRPGASLRNSQGWPIMHFQILSQWVRIYTCSSWNTNRICRINIMNSWEYPACGGTWRMVHVLVLAMIWNQALVQEILPSSALHVHSQESTCLSVGSRSMKGKWSFVTCANNCYTMAVRLLHGVQICW
jgi:hypothetical protein